jgi:2-oxo-hept-3-ene-1,7-dioate hydratase
LSHQLREAALALDQAERTRRQIRMLTLAYPDMTMADAYRIQDAWLDIKRTRGRKIIGHKIGLTSKAMQQAVNIATPDSGFLLDDMLFAEGASVPCERFIGLRIEAELAFVLKAPLEGAHLTIEDVYSATEYVSPALEILDTRIFRVDPETKRTRTVLDTISDNAANAGIVMGRTRLKPEAVDLRWIGAILSKNGEIEETGLAAGVLGHPANGVVWLAQRFAEQGKSLSAGDIVLAGSFIRPVEVGRGDAVVADYGPHGVVSVNFA